MTEKRSMTIVGAGLAGLALVDALLNRGVDPGSLTVVDDADPHRGSASPATMLHPFPGRRMDLRRGQGEAFVTSWRRLEQWAEELGEDWWRPAPMVRPLQGDERGKRLLETWQEERTDYPDEIHVQWSDPGGVRLKFDELQPSSPALVYGPAAAVDLPKLTDRLRADQQKAGVTFVADRLADLESIAEGWELKLADGGPRRTRRVVLAVGASLQEFFRGLDLRRKAGEVALLDPGDRELPALVNATKHVFERPDGRWGLGSTYFRVEEWDGRDDERVVDQLVDGVADVVPAVADCEVVDVWRGQRGVFGSDHMPLVGEVPKAAGLYTCGAFGSKGLLWAPAAAGDLAAELTGETGAISRHQQTGRMSADKWELVEG